MNCRLLLADDHALIRAGIRAMVGGAGGYEVVGEATDGAEAIDLACGLDPDVILLDISMKGVDGLQALHRLSEVAPRSKVLMLSMHSDPKMISSALQRGAQGYLLKDAALTELHPALQAVVRGERYLSSAISAPVVEQALAAARARPALTPRQVEILRLITRGVPARSIASGLKLSVKTVEAHRAQIMHRLDIHDLPGLVLYAVREGLIHADD
jgi:DNA-binding NarL/FixJ family response regulator